MPSSSAHRRTRAATLASTATALALGTALLGATAFAADEDPIAARQAIMKSFGRASRDTGNMLKGQADFDLAKVQAALKTYADGSKRFAGLFPETSKTGGDTHALPAIWENKQDFEARNAKFAADSEAAQAAITDEASFKATFPKLLAECGACHKQYRARD